MIRLAPLLIGLLPAFLLLSACSDEPVPADPAIWRVDGPEGQQAWLFGTIHGLDKPADWQTAAVARALTSADVLIVEVAGLEDQAAMARTFARLARTPDLPPLLQRVTPPAREALARLMRQHGLDEKQFAEVETWAAALTLARAAGSANKAKHGIDRAVMRAFAGRPVIELEGADAQLRIFDRLPEKEQRDLLEAVIADADAAMGDTADLPRAWREGDMAAIERESRKGLLADPELRQALFTTRNLAWRDRIIGTMREGRRPFVAVGAAHMAGADGLPRLLAAKGYSVTRLD